MSDINKLHEYENRPKKKNPFRSKPIPKSRIEWAIRSTMSIRAAAQYLGVAYNTFKKYAKMYDLFEQNKNQTFLIPTNFSFQEAAVIPECFFTSWSNLVDRGKLKSNQKILIQKF